MNMGVAGGIYLQRIWDWFIIGILLGELFDSDVEADCSWLASRAFGVIGGPQYTPSHLFD